MNDHEPIEMVSDPDYSSRVVDPNTEGREATPELRRGPTTAGFDRQRTVNASRRGPRRTGSVATHRSAAGQSLGYSAYPVPTSSEREYENRLQDELAVEDIERKFTADESSRPSMASGRDSTHLVPNPEPVDEFDAATDHPLEGKAAVIAAAQYMRNQNTTPSIAKFFIKVHRSSFLVRYMTYIVPLVLIILIPLLVGAIAFPDASLGGVQLLWFCIWLEIVWLTLWAGRIIAKMIPYAVLILTSIFTNDTKRWVEMARQLEMSLTIFFWWLAVEISFLPTMKNHHVDGASGTKSWETIVNKLIITTLVGAALTLFEKIVMQFVAMAFHMRTYADRIEVNRFQISSLARLYAYSKEKIGSVSNREFDQPPASSGSYNPKKNSIHVSSAQRDATKQKLAHTKTAYVNKAGRAARTAIHAVGDVAGAVAGDFTGRAISKSSDPRPVVNELLRTTAGSQVLARRLYRTFVALRMEKTDAEDAQHEKHKDEDEDGDSSTADEYEEDEPLTISHEDLKLAFGNEEEAEAAFTMFDKDMNGDISMEELEAVCVEIGRERKSISASLKDLDDVVGKLDKVLLFLVAVITLIVLLSLISTSTAGVLTSMGSSLLALSWLFQATAQEFLQSVVFVFVKHPFDVGDRVTVYGNTGAMGTGDDYFVKQISLLYTEFKKMEGHIVQAPNSYLNSLFVLNQRRSGALAEAIPVVIRFGTTMEQIEQLRNDLLAFVREEKREYQANILTEMKQVTENYSVTFNVVFFYKSSWQNELLRLQRRNKFICRLMLALMDANIQGPRTNLPGASAAAPWFINTHDGQSAATALSSPSDDSSPQGPPNDDAQPRRDSVSSMTSSSAQNNPQRMNTSSSGHNGISRNSSRRGPVDLSLGMTSVMHNGMDEEDDLHDDRGPNRFASMIRRFHSNRLDRAPTNGKRLDVVQEAEPNRQEDSTELSRQPSFAPSRSSSRPSRTWSFRNLMGNSSKERPSSQQASVSRSNSARPSFDSSPLTRGDNAHDLESGTFQPQGHQLRQESSKEPFPPLAQDKYP